MMDRATLEARLKKEREDEAFYREMAKQHPHSERFFYDLARDEQTHAELIEHIIEKLDH